MHIYKTYWWKTASVAVGIFRRGIKMATGCEHGSEGIVMPPPPLTRVERQTEE